METIRETIKKQVHHYYWDLDINCARTCLLCLSELFHIKLQEQTICAAIGLHGAGGYRAQCGLVEGALMFLAVYCSEKGKTESETAEICYTFADRFTKKYESLRCYDLRPNGFTDNDPPHACESLTVDAIAFAYEFICAIEK